MNSHTHQKSSQTVNAVYRIISVAAIAVLLVDSIPAQVVTTDQNSAAVASQELVENSSSSPACVCPEVESANSDVQANTSAQTLQTGDKPNMAVSPYISCRRKGRSQIPCPCKCVDAQGIADEQGYELKTGPYGGKQKPKKQN